MRHLRLWKCLKGTVSGFYQLRDLHDKFTFLDELAEDAAKLLETLKNNTEMGGEDERGPFMRIPKDVWDKAWAEAKKGGE